MSFVKVNVQGEIFCLPCNENSVPIDAVKNVNSGAQTLAKYNNRNDICAVVNGQVKLHEDYRECTYVVVPETQDNTLEGRARSLLMQQNFVPALRHAYKGNTQHSKQMPSTSISPLSPMPSTSFSPPVSQYRPKIKKRRGSDIRGGNEVIMIKLVKDIGKYPVSPSGAYIHGQVMVEMSRTAEHEEIMATILKAAHQVPHLLEVNESNLTFLRYESKKLNKLYMEDGWRWTFQKLKTLQGKGCLYIQLIGIAAPSDTEDEFDLSLSPNPSNTNVSQSNVTPIDNTLQGENQNGTTFSRNDYSEGQDVENVDFFEYQPVGLEEEDALQRAISESLQEGEHLESESSMRQSRRQNDNLSTEEVVGMLMAHSEATVSGRRRRMVVARTNVWLSTLNFFKQKRHVSSKGPLEVIFVGDSETQEDGLDLGGPKREYFRLLLTDVVKRSSLLQELGPDEGVTFRAKISSLHKGEFKILGKALATLIVQGGPPCCIFATSVVDYLITGNSINIQPALSECVDGHVRRDLRKLADAETKEAFEAVLKECEWRFNVDGLGCSVKFQNRAEFLAACATYFAINTIQPMLDQFREGLQEYDMLHLITQNEPLGRFLLENRNTKPSADAIIRLLKPVYSPKGSPKRQKEELLMVQLTEFLKASEDGSLKELIEEEEMESNTMQEYVEKLTPGHVLSFYTGANQQPAAGFGETPKVTFVHDNDKCLPTANTCSNELVLFVNDDTISPNFAGMMVRSLMNGVTFSLI